MKNIKSCDGIEKYNNQNYIRVSDGIYLYKESYVTTLSFQQEPELGEGEDSAHISQYPLEDILDRFSVYISDFFENHNTVDASSCWLEFTGFSQEDIKRLRTIIGKHVYNRNLDSGVELVIE